MDALFDVPLLAPNFRNQCLERSGGSDLPNRLGRPWQVAPQLRRTPGSSTLVPHLQGLPKNTTCQKKTFVAVGHRGSHSWHPQNPARTCERQNRTLLLVVMPGALSSVLAPSWGCAWVVGGSARLVFQLVGEVFTRLVFPHRPRRA